MPKSQATPKPLTHSPGVLSTIFSGLSKSLAGSAKILYVAIPQPQNEPDDELSKSPQPGRCDMPNALSLDFPGRTSMLDGDTHPGINIAAAIKLDTSSLTTQVAFSKKVEAGESPCFYKVLSFVKTFDYKYNRVKTSQNTGKQYNVISICITKQMYEAVGTASSHRRILSGSTLAPSTSPTSPRSPVGIAPTAQGYDSLSENTAVEEAEAEWDKALEEDCDKRMFALVDGLDLAWVPAKVKRNLWAQVAEKNSGKYRSSSMTPLAEEHDRLKKRLDMVTAQEAPSIGSEDTINALSQKRAADLASLEKAARREKQTMQAIIDDLAKNLNVSRQEIVKYEASKRTTIREGGSLLSDNLDFVQSQKKIRNQLKSTENNVAGNTPQPHTRDHAKTRTEQRKHTGVASETQSHGSNLSVDGAKEEIAKLETRNDELASSKNDLTSRLNTSEDRVRQLERLLSASNDYFATETSSSNSANAVLRDKVKSLSETVEIQKNLSKKAQDQLKSTTSVYKLKLKDQEEYYQQSLRTLKNNVEKPLENETQLRRDIKAQFQKQFNDAMKKKAKLRKEADARLEKRLISLKACGQQLVRHYAYLGIDLLEYMLKMEKLITSEGYVIENQEYDLFIAKARRALLYFKREEDDDAIFYGDEDDSEDNEYDSGAEGDETKDEEEAYEDGKHLQGEEVAGQVAIEWRPEAVIEKLDGMTTSEAANVSLEDQVQVAEDLASIAILELFAEEITNCDVLSDPNGANSQGETPTEATTQEIEDDEVDKWEERPMRSRLAKRKGKELESDHLKAGSLEEEVKPTNGSDLLPETTDVEGIFGTKNAALKSQDKVCATEAKRLQEQEDEALAKVLHRSASKKNAHADGAVDEAAIELPPSASAVRLQGAEGVASSQGAGSTAKEAATDFTFGTCQNDNTETTLPSNAAALSLNIISFTDTSCTATFTTPPPTPNSIPKRPQPAQEEPRTKLGKTRAQVEAEVAAALALRKMEEEKEACTTTAEGENETTASHPRKTKAERRAAAIKARKEAAEKEEAAAKKKSKSRKQRR